VLGCSTGEEAYSIAMSFVEAAQPTTRPRKLQVFATDLNEAGLKKARHGLYDRHVIRDVSPERLQRFFVEEDGGYRVSKSLREMVVFARHDVISDPPFSRMELISCRNLLIYFDAALQKRVFPMFHYALRPGGFDVQPRPGVHFERLRPLEAEQTDHAINVERQHRPVGVHGPSVASEARDPTPCTIPRRAYDQSADPQGPQPADEEGGHPRPQVRSGAEAPHRGTPAARRMHSRLHGDPEEAELGPPQGGPRSAHQRHGGHLLHPGRGAQPPGALGRARPRRPRQGSSGRPLQGRPRHA